MYNDTAAQFTLSISREALRDHLADLKRRKMRLLANTALGNVETHNVLGYHLQQAYGMVPRSEVESLNLRINAAMEALYLWNELEPEPIQPPLCYEAKVPTDAT